MKFLAPCFSSILRLNMSMPFNYLFISFQALISKDAVISLILNTMHCPKCAQICIEWMVNSFFELCHLLWLHLFCVLFYPHFCHFLLSQHSPDTFYWLYKMNQLTCWPWALQNSSLLPPYVFNLFLMQPVETTPCSIWCVTVLQGHLCSWLPYVSLGTKRNL